ncbi:F-actin-capping protein subunit beta [Scheffersomyces coipomensis]|uniref:F-actin-capping protein subunit beta n=1 Tax=Scheffersomyces coipomensis TaxID=1788519 RepID=UPI00315D7C71
MASYEEKFDASLDLLRRLDPKSIAKNLNDICTVIQNNDHDSTGEDLVQDLLSSIDTPLKVSKCKESGKDYLSCDYNRDGDSYRSPWSNKYYPTPQADDDQPPPFPSSSLRQLEIKANDSFDIYRDLYYEGAGISSVYLWDTAEDDENTLQDGFAGVVLIKKETDDGSGKWDSIHVFEVIPESSTSYLYKLTTSVILDLQNQKLSSLSLSGTLTRQLESVQSIEVDGGVNLETNHLINLGTLVEKSEYNIRNLLQEVYFDKLKDIMLKDLRSIGDIGDKKLEDLRQSELIKGLQTL